MNLKIQSPRIDFLVRFLLISFLILLLWKPLSYIFMLFLGYLIKCVFKIIGNGIDIKIISQNIFFDYSEIFSQDISFPVQNIDQIYLNIIIIFSLLFSTPGITIKKRTRYFFFFFLVMSFVYTMIFYMYSFTFLKDYIAAHYSNLDEQVLRIFRESFPESKMRLYDKLLFHWNSWGWDVIPLFLWLPLGYKRVIKLTQRQQDTEPPRK